MNKDNVGAVRLIYVLSIGLLTFPCCSDIRGQDLGRVDPNAIEVFADDFFGTQMESLHVPGAAFVVVEGDQIVFSKGYGYANLDEKKPFVPERTLLPVGSVSKLFTATAVMQLYEQGRIDLHKDVNTYLKHLRIPATYPEPVTMAHLLTHSAGFDAPTIGTLSRSVAEQPTLGDHLAARMPPRVRPAGTVISYCNYGVALAGYIVQVVSSMPFDQYVHEHILQPLQMRHSSFVAHDGIAEDAATGYWYQPPDVYGPIQPYYLNIPPAGQLTATATDMANFMIAHLQHGRFKNTRILQQATVRQMHERQFAHHAELPGWCYGFNESFRNGYRTTGHAGGISGVWSYLLLVPTEQAGFFVSQNGGGGFLAPPLIEAFMDDFFPGSSRIPNMSVRSSSSAPGGVPAGRYRYTVHSRTTIEKLQVLLSVPELEVRTKEGGLLTVENHHPGHLEVPPGPYEEISPLLFREVDGQCLIAFRKNAQGRVRYLVTDSHWDAISYDKLSWYDHPILHLKLLAFCSLVFLSACITWPVGALIRRIRKKERVALTQQQEKIRRQGRRARLWARVTCALALGTLLALVLCLYVSPPQLAYGELGIIPLLLVLPLITTALTVCLVVFLVRAWRDKYWSLLGRLHCTLVVVAAVALIPFLMYWNLFGFNY
jgi:CubicO group peptidase (beta-lactamase class C family)